MNFFGAMKVYMAVSLIAPMGSSLIQPVATSWINATTGKGLGEQKKGQKLVFFPY